MSSLCDAEKIHEEIIIPIMHAREKDLALVLTAPLVERHADLESAIDRMILGYAVILLEGSRHCFAVKVAFLNTRSVDEPANEKAIQGQNI